MAQRQHVHIGKQKGLFWMDNSMIKVHCKDDPDEIEFHASGTRVEITIDQPKLVEEQTPLVIKLDPGNSRVVQLKKDCPRGMYEYGVITLDVDPPNDPPKIVVNGDTHG
jgi:hypothetical protein